MKEVKNKSSSDVNVLQKHSQATEEQIRVAKLSQITNKEDQQIQKQINEILDITRKPPDLVSIALHDCHYDTTLAIQNLLEGKYDEEEDEWQTSSGKKGRKPAGISSPASSTPPPTTTVTEENESFETVNNLDEKPGSNKSNSSRGGGGGNRGRSSSRNKRGEDNTSSEEKWDLQEKGERHSKASDRGRNRGRGRGASRGGGRGGRGGGFGRGGGGGFGRGASSNRGSNRSRGVGRGSGRRGPRENRIKENGFGAPRETGFGEGFGQPTTEDTNINNEESWDLDVGNTGRTESWGDDIPEETSTSNDWGKDSWADVTVSTESHVDSLFSNNKDDWSLMNGNSESHTDHWEGETEKLQSNNKGTYIPEQVDAAVICSIPTSSTSAAEVTSYQPTNDISRYISSSSNQFPSSQQEGGLTNSLNDRAFSLASTINSLPDSLKQTMSQMPMVSGITESHKLEQEQLRNPKPPDSSGVREVPTPEQQIQKPRSRNSNKNSTLPSQPVVMPRSAQMVHDTDDQFVGLEFGSGPVSPRVLKTSNSPSPSTVSINTSDIMEGSIKRQPIASLESAPPQQQQQQQPPQAPTESYGKPILPQTQTVSPIKKESDSKKDVTTDQDLAQSLNNTLKPLDQPDVKSHFMGSPSRTLGHGITPEPIPFPSSTNLPPSTSSSPLNVFGRHGGLSAGVKMVDQKQQQQQQTQQQPAANQPSSLSNYRDKQTYEKNEQSTNAEKVLADQKALAEKQYLAEQQRVLAEQQREQTKTEQRAFAEQKALAQQKLLASQSKEELSTRNDSLQDSRKKLTDHRLGLSEKPSNTKETAKLPSSDSTYSTKNHRTTNPRSISSPPGFSSVYTSKSSELLNQSTTKPSGANIKTQTKTSSPPGMIHPGNNMLYTHGVQPGIVSPYQQVHGYNYEELLHLHRLQLPQSAYHYDISTIYPPNATSAATREGLPNFPGGDSKFPRGNDDTTQASLHHHANPHVAASNINAHQAYLNTTGQIPYGIPYGYPGVIPQAGIYPTYTAPNVFQLNHATKGVVGTQYQSQFAGQHGFNAGKYSGATEFSKGNFHASGSAQTTMSGKSSQQNNLNNHNDSNSSVQGAGQFKGQGYNDGFLATSPSTQPNMALHAQAGHIGNMNHPYLLAQQQQQQQHPNLLPGQVSAAQLGHQGNIDNRNSSHQGTFGGSQKRDAGKGSYQSYWSGNR